MIEFNYKPIEVIPFKTASRKKFVWRPIIPVFLIVGKIIVGYEALIDSGADYNVFDGEIATILKINLTRGKKRQISGLGNQIIKGYEHKLQIKVGDRIFISKIIFSNQIPPHSFGVLGNDGFFNRFKVTFDYPRKLIEIGRQVD